MKRILLLWMIVLCSQPFPASGQQVSGAFLDRYARTEGFSSVQLERKMMRMMSRQAADRGDAALARLLDGIESIRIVAVDGGDDTEFLQAADSLIARPSCRFQLVMSESDSGQTTRFYLRNAVPPGYSELLMVTSGPRETVVVNIYGCFDLKQVSRLSTIRPKRTEE